MTQNPNKVIFKNTKVIIQNSSPAPFGKGDRTVLDETVRKAFEIKAEELKTDEDWLEPPDRLLYQKRKQKSGVEFELNQWDILYCDDDVIH